jgi:hypothetical protein
VIPVADPAAVFWPRYNARETPSCKLKEAILPGAGGAGARAK